ncbi:hypothetical protein RRSWK_03567 [Rhodopirellula sp. SWK7]|nr:hypothetical protein RRSWK_03567 [Rhodopirellula sp. SWK7]
MSSELPPSLTMISNGRSATVDVRHFVIAFDSFHVGMTTETDLLDD